MSASLRRLLALGICLFHLHLEADAVLAQQDVVPTAEQALKGFEESLRTLATVKFNLQSKTYESGGAFPAETWLYLTTAEYVRDDAQWRYRWKSIGNNYHGKFLPYRQEYERLMNGTNFLAAREYEVVNRITESEADALANEPWGEGKSVNVYVTYEDASDDAVQGFARQNETRVLNGCLTVDSGRSLSQLMREASPKMEPETVLVDGHATYVVTSKGPLGTHTMWLDPAAGFLPRRIRCEKRGSDLFAGQPVGEIPARGDAEHRRPNKPMAGCDYEIDHIKIEQIDEKPFIVGYHETTVYLYQGGDQFTSRNEVSLSQADLDPPEDALKLTMEIPNGTSVHVYNYPQIDCEWKDGQVVKVVDASVVNGLADLRFEAAQSPARRWLVVANVALVAILFAVLLYRRITFKG
jgi:hypothetical protein